MVELFGGQRPTISKHINNIFSSNELKVGSVSSILELTADDGKNFGKDYFDELLERIREIRASEMRFYQKIEVKKALASRWETSPLLFEPWRNNDGQYFSHVPPIKYPLV